MELERLSPALGAEVLGLDLGREIADADAGALRDAFDRFHLLLFRGQSLDPERHVAVCSWFGPILFERGAHVGYVSNVRPDGIIRTGALLFHSDLAFTPEPLPGLSLHALEVPADGAPTVFANAVRAAAALPDGLRARVAGRQVVNVYGFKLPYDRRMRERDLPPGSPVARHPVVGVHRRTGADVVMAGELHTDRIVGRIVGRIAGRIADLPEGESEALLAALFAVLYAPDNLYVHRWQVGDLLVWDNAALQHGRPEFAEAEARTLQRVTIAARGSYDLVPNLADLLA